MSHQPPSSQLRNRGGPRRDLGAARDAYAARDAAASERAHTPHTPAPCAEPGHGVGGSGLKASLALGAFEGLAAATVLLSVGVAAGGGSAVAPAAAASAGLALACAARTYIKQRLHRDTFARERAREAWELASYPEGERAEMVELYVSKGMAPADARAAVDALAKAPAAFFVDIMMAQELGMALPDAAAPALHACSAGAGFAASALLPLVLSWWALGALAAHGATPGELLSAAALAAQARALRDGATAALDAAVASWVTASPLDAGAAWAALRAGAGHPAVALHGAALALLGQLLAVRALLDARGSGGTGGAAWVLPAVALALLGAAALAARAAGGLAAWGGEAA
jgi:hypothetical protein